MNTDQKVKKVVGAIIYDETGKIFLMTSGKWRGRWAVPGGEMHPNETEEDALRREIREEIDIEISNIKKIGEKVKPASEDYIESDTLLHFIDFIARAESKDIDPNHEVDTHSWFEPQYALENLNLLDSAREFVEKYISLEKPNGSTTAKKEDSSEELLSIADFTSDKD